MTGTGTITKILLRGAITLALVLSLFAVCQAASDVYYLKPQANTHNNSYNSVSQTFVGTCDSISKIAFFLGQNTGNSNYLMEIDSAGIAKGGVLTLSATLAKAYAENEGTYATPVGVKRGYTYTLKFSRQTPSQKVDFYYLADTTAYPWGKITDPIVTGDLCARVIGTGRVLNQWGINAFGSGAGIMSDVGIQRDREQVVLGINPNNKLMHPGVWANGLWADSVTFNWNLLDPFVTSAAQNGIEIMFNPLGSAYWAACVDTTDSLHHWIAKPDSGGWALFFPPRNLREPVLDPLHPNNVNTHNYWAKFFYEFVRRYGPKGTARNWDPVGTFWTTYYKPVKYWEIDNEVNDRAFWRWGYTLRCWKMWYPNRDYNTPADSAAFFHDTLAAGNSYRQRYWMGLYIRQCAVADSVINYLLYPNTNRDSVKILTHGASIVNHGNNPDCNPESWGKNWIRTFYEMGGKPFSDGITYHAYQEVDSNYVKIHRFVPRFFEADYDTVRAIMTANGDKGLCWPDEQGWGTTTDTTGKNGLFVTRSKQADCIVQMYTVGAALGASPYGPLNHQALYQLYDYRNAETDTWYEHAGVVDSTGTAQKESYYAFKQLNTKIKNLYFNRQVPVGTPSDSVFCYEFQDTGASSKKTWVVWKSSGQAVLESLTARTTQYDSINIAYNAYPDSGGYSTSQSGYFPVRVEIFPKYFREQGTIARPDIIVDSVWIVPDTARAGEGLRFYARIRNIGNDSLRASIPDTVTFQVDGATKIKYRASRGLASFKTPRDTLDTLTVGYIGVAPVPDWYATWGDHLIKAWADSSDKYVELREDNNMGYIFKHMKPKGKVIIPTTGYNQGYPTSGRKFSNVRPVKLSMLSNDSIPPLAQKMRIMNSWEYPTWRAWRNYASSWWDTLPATDGQYYVQARFKMANGESTATVVDTIILDQTVPNAWISSPAHGATISGSVPIYGQAYDVGGYFRFDTLKYHQQTTHQHDTIHVSLFPIGEMMPALLGTWNTTLVTPGLTRETLAVYDSAGNVKKDSITLTVNNSSTDGGASWATGFGTYTSPVMNVATDPGGNVYLAETQNSKVRRYSSRKDSLFAFSARRGNDSTGLNWAVSMALKDSTALYIADGYAHAIKAFDRQGNLLLRFGSFGTGQGQFKQPCGIALDHKGRLFVVDRLNHRVQVFSDTSGAFLFQFGSQGQDSGKFNSPTGIAITLKDTLLGIAQDLIWVSDTKNDQIQVFDSLGNYIKTIKQPDILGFDTPTGICADKWGDVYVADTKHNRIVELNPYGQRIFDFGGLGDSLWQFRTPIGVAVSPGAHYLYVADMGNKRVQRFWVIQDDTLGGGGPQGGAGVQVLPMVYELGPAIPNPSNGATTIRYSLPKESVVSMKIYNVAGQVVREFNQGKQKAGYYSITWDGRSNRGHKVGAGVYFYRLEAGSWVKTRKMIVLR